MFKLDEKIPLLVDPEQLWMHLGDAVALDYEYLRVCGECSGRKICIYLHLKSMGDEVLVELTGLSIEVGSDTPIDDYITRLLSYSSIVRSRGGRVEFYTGRESAVGVYYMSCNSRLSIVEANLLEYEDMVLFMGEESDYS